MILVTGVAGFIGFHTARQLVLQGKEVYGIDNLNDYYDVDLKEGRLTELRRGPGNDLFHFKKVELANQKEIEAVFDKNDIEKVIHLGAQAGVRYSLSHPYTYVDSNLVGFVNIMETARRHDLKHLVYASSSSVYGANNKIPFSVEDTTDHPISLYAATKKANELLAYSYSHLYGMRTTGLRFFTVYGPWGRPDMALFHFTKNILAGIPIKVFNNGQMKRDFTYIDDIVDGILRLVYRIPSDQDGENKSTNIDSTIPFEIFNLGSGCPIGLLTMIEILESCLGQKAIRQYLPLQPGDMLETYAALDNLESAIGPMQHTSLADGIARFVEWYLNYYQ